MTEAYSPPLANSPEARSPSGEILNLASTQPVTTPQASTPNPNPSDPNGNPAANPAPATAPAPGVPAAYDLKAPEGQTLDSAVLESATPIFRELGLDNAAAQKLVDFYTAQTAKQADVARSAITDMGTRWSAETLANPKLGPHIDTIKADVGSALNILEERNPGIKARFTSAMDQTMVGNHPAFVETFWEFAKALAPGKHVGGGGPSPLGQTPSGTIAPKTAAAAMYPHLVSKTG